MKGMELQGIEQHEDKNAYKTSTRNNIGATMAKLSLFKKFAFCK